MQTDRRTLLKGLAAAGLAVSGIGWARASNSNARTTADSTEVLAVTSSLQASALDAAFVAGVQNAACNVSHTGLQGLDSAAFTRLGNLLADGQETLLVGLLDDACATLVLDLVRSAGGRVLAMDNHRIDRTATDWAQHLGQSLASGQTFTPSRIAAGSEARVSFRCVI
ncbi:twin-arginine translocation signal domain-containing protein [Comamonas sp. NoAH]|uniref:twin-arginine translocation signal domain-containing protein n=1 Tax=Comamonas halotolerans TaxID=3041496 RepID=UPI0024E10469|nr:twin-arginine translocation signal domain-containing protein [Comamonas sp. NoAH]